MLASSMERRPHFILTVKCLPILVFQAMVRPAATTLPRALRACCARALPAARCNRLDNHTALSRRMHARFLACSSARTRLLHRFNPMFYGRR